MEGVGGRGQAIQQRGGGEVGRGLSSYALAIRCAVLTVVGAARRDVKEESHSGGVPRKMEVTVPRTAALHPKMEAGGEGAEQEVRVLGEELRRVKGE
eukprot:311589-Rhodomonas_salina.3